MFCNEYTHYVASNALAALGVSSNLLLLYVIYTDTKSKSSGYRMMLSIISIYNVYFSIVMRAVWPAYILDERGFILFTRSFLEYSPQVQFWALATFGNSFGQSLSLLGVHCLYRYVKITDKFKSIFNTWYGIAFVLAGHIGFSCAYESFCVFTMQPTAARNSYSAEDSRNLLNITMTPQTYYYGPVYYYPNSNGVEEYHLVQILGTLACLAACGGFYSFMCGTGIKLYFHVKNSAMSQSTKRMQIQLLRTLLAQALSPAFFEFIPAGFIFFGGPTGLVPHDWGLCTSFFLAGYSSSDAIMVLLFFKAYRQRTMEIFLYPLHKCLGISKRRVDIATKTSGTDKDSAYKGRDSDNVLQLPK